MSWKQLERRITYKSPHMEAWEDTVELPSGDVIDDFSGITLPDGVLIVVTDTQGNLLMFEEYKYAVNDTVLTFPGGSIDPGESPEQTALRELTEETGYVASETELLCVMYPYPSKIAHKNYTVRIKNAYKNSEAEHSSTEQGSIGVVQKISPQQIPRLIKQGKINTPHVFTALAIAFPENL